MKIQLTTKFLQLEQLITDKQKRGLKLEFTIKKISVEITGEDGYDELQLDLNAGNLSIVTINSGDINKIRDIYDYIDGEMFDQFMKYLIEYWVDSMEDDFIHNKL